MLQTKRKHCRFGTGPCNFPPALKLNFRPSCQFGSNGERSIENRSQVNQDMVR
jgi:hypothetical protein